MQHAVKEVVSGVASVVRRWCEQQAHRHYFDETLGSMELIAAAKLHHELTEVGVPATIVFSEGLQDHCYVRVDTCNMVVDVAATQYNRQGFDFKPVEVLSMDVVLDGPAASLYCGKITEFHTVEALVAHMLKICDRVVVPVVDQGKILIRD